jgi:microcompartment protein CcmL/EutN
MALVNPALAILEFDSVAAGILAGDAMVKRGPIDDIRAGTVHPGRYLVMVAGDVASVGEAIAAGREAWEESLVDEVFLPDVHPDVVAAIGGRRVRGVAESLGVIETTTVSATIEAADAAVKGAEVELLEVRLADGLGGKAYALFSGSLSDVEAGVGLGVATTDAGVLVGSVVVPRLDAEMAENLYLDPRFAARVGRGLDALG